MTNHLSTLLFLACTAPGLTLSLPIQAQAGGPTDPPVLLGPGGFVFQDKPDSITVHRDKTLLCTFRKGDESYIYLGDGDVLVSFADSTIVDLKPGEYPYWVTGHWGKPLRSAGPYPVPKAGRLPEATLLVTKTEICLQRAAKTRCSDRK